MKIDSIAEWCKWLEKNFSPETMIPTLPVIIRLDGNNFSTWTKGLNKPFDENLSDLMIELTKFLVKETNAVIGYTQSDEITLILYTDDKNISIYNEGRKHKILSKLTGKCVTFFNTKRLSYLPNHNKFANFDCRVYQTPTLQDACIQLLWRENDASKNSISMLAQSLFSYNSLLNLNGNEKQEKMMVEKGVNWNDLPVKFKRGTYIKRVKTSKPFSSEELSKLPPKHNAHKNPNLIIERHDISVLDLPIFNKIKNKVGVVFHDEKFILHSDDYKSNNKTIGWLSDIK